MEIVKKDSEEPSASPVPADSQRKDLGGVMESSSLDLLRSPSAGAEDLYDSLLAETTRPSEELALLQAEAAAQEEAMPGEGSRKFWQGERKEREEGSDVDDAQQTLFSEGGEDTPHSQAAPQTEPETGPQSAGEQKATMPADEADATSEDAPANKAEASHTQQLGPAPQVAPLGLAGSIHTCGW